MEKGVPLRSGSLSSLCAATDLNDVAANGYRFYAYGREAKL